MSNLNKKQFEAVETVNGPVVIIAGPGTGKTKTLVERTVNILVNKKVEAKKIIITTFINKTGRRSGGAGAAPCRAARETRVHDAGPGGRHRIHQDGREHICPLAKAE